MTPAGLLLVGALLIAGSMSAAFLLARRIDNFSIVDVAWSANFTILAILYAALGRGDGARRAVIAGLATLWSLRLAGHLLARIARLHPEEEGRYRTLRRRWAGALGRRFFVFFLAQGLLNVALSTPFLASALDPRRGLGPFEWAGVLVVLVGLAGEATADAQLAAFKGVPGNRGRTCSAGLWRYSRHPNYFFEWLVWCGFFLFALASPLGFATVYCPLLMLWFLFRVTGVPATEAQALSTKGDEYREYQRTTSAFVPWFPRP